MVITLYLRRGRRAPRLLVELCRGTIGNCMQLEKAAAVPQFARVRGFFRVPDRED